MQSLKIPLHKYATDQPFTFKGGIEDFIRVYTTMEFEVVYSIHGSENEISCRLELY